MEFCARVLVTAAVLMLSACKGPELEFDRGYVLDHDGQQLTATITKRRVWDPNDPTDSVMAENQRYYLVVRNNGKKQLSLVAGLARGFEVSSSGEHISHLWIGFYDRLPGMEGQTSRNRTVVPDEVIVSFRWRRSFELGVNEEKEFEFLRLGRDSSVKFEPGTRLHLFWESLRIEESGGGEAFVGRQAEFKDRMCACKDKACADQVTADTVKWFSEQKGKYIEMSDDDRRKEAAIEDERNRCQTKVLSDAAAAVAGSSATGPGSAVDSGASAGRSR